MIGIVTGAVSRVVVIDIDTDEGREAIQAYILIDLDAYLSDSQRRTAPYFEAPAKCPSKTRWFPVRLRGEGGYVVRLRQERDRKAYAWMGGLSITREPAALPLSIYLY